MLRKFELRMPVRAAPRRARGCFLAVGLCLTACGNATLEFDPNRDDLSASRRVKNGLHVLGNQIVDGDGNVVVLYGVNRSGTEYACIQGWGFFDGPSDDTSLDAIKTWQANAIRIPMNEDCWLAINGAPEAYSGAAYQQAISGFVQRILDKGLIPILELHWSAAGSGQATRQEPMPNRDHSVAFWTAVASAYGGQGNVVLEPFNEPYPDFNRDTDAAWDCWANGGTCSGMNFEAAGMQELVTAIRDAGATNLVLLGGVQYSNSLSQWLARRPSDPLNNIAPAWHVYNFNRCRDSTCYEREVAPVADQYPVVATEIGEDDCRSGFIAPLMSWLDGHGGSYLAWTWDTWGGCLVLISDYSGTPANEYGRAYRDHLLGL